MGDRLGINDHRDGDTHKVDPQISKYPYEKEFITPPTTEEEEERFRLRRLITTLQRIAGKVARNPPRCNLQPREKQSVHFLGTRNPSLLPPDKGGEFCVVSQEQYTAAALAHLSYERTYRELPHAIPSSMATRTEKEINDKWKAICQVSNLNRRIQREFTTTNSTLPKFYCLFRTHKEHPFRKVRPIVSGIGAPDRKIIWLLSHILKPLEKFLTATAGAPQPT